MSVARRTRRLWTDEEKRSICLQTTAPDVSVAQVALRYTVNAILIFKWLRDSKYRPKPGTGSKEAGLRFLPVTIIAEARAPAAAPVADSCIEIELAGGHRMRISGSYGPEVLARLIRGLTASSRFQRTNGSGCQRASPTCARGSRRLRHRPRRC